VETMLIGQVAKQTGVGVETIRFYECSGLIEELPRRASRYREYPASVIDRLRFIKTGKELGFSLKEIEELLTLRVDPRATCAQVKQRAEAKIADVEEKIKTLRRIKKTLGKIVASCKGEGPTEECPILDALGPSVGAVFGSRPENGHGPTLPPTSQLCVNGRSGCIGAPHGDIPPPCDETARRRDRDYFEEF